MSSDKRLGRGLNALFTQVELDEESAVREIEIEKISPNPYQPRKTFVEEPLVELKNSLLKHGFLQPLVVRKTASSQRYELVVGERRLRAAQLAHFSRVPVVVKELEDEEMMEFALVENVQREDLNPLEIAESLSQLQHHLSLTQRQLAERVGMSRSLVANYLRLNELPLEIKEHVSRGTLSMGHAKTLLGIREVSLQITWAKRVVLEQWSVRQLETVVQRINRTDRGEEGEVASSLAPPSCADSRTDSYEKQLREQLNAQVHIKPGSKKGKIEIVYFSEEELERIVKQMIH
jgi:ParB family chromosome partitioning protein